MTPAEKVQQAQQILSDRQRAYQVAFAENEATKLVLADLAEFCRAQVTTFHADPRVAAMLDGRREVYLRIQKYMTWPQEKLFQSQGVDNG